MAASSLALFSVCLNTSCCLKFAGILSDNTFNYKNLNHLLYTKFNAVSRKKQGKAHNSISFLSLNVDVFTSDFDACPEKNLDFINFDDLPCIWLHNW